VILEIAIHAILSLSGLLLARKITKPPCKSEDL